MALQHYANFDKHGLRNPTAWAVCLGLGGFARASVRGEIRLDVLVGVSDAAFDHDEGGSLPWGRHTSSVPMATLSIFAVSRRLRRRRIPFEM